MSLSTTWPQRSPCQSRASHGAVMARICPHWALLTLQHQTKKQPSQDNLNEECGCGSGCATYLRPLPPALCKFELAAPCTRSVLHTA
eukprot:1846035-Rhodomonas_salina.1